MATNKTVILVESPNKVATIKSLLRGTKYEGAIVKASVGHICHIADNKQSYKNSGIFPEDSFKIDYKVMQEKKDLVKELKKYTDDADIVYLCTDEDREGEAISWFLMEFLKIPVKKCRRATFHEITKNAVITALDNPRQLDLQLVDAAKSRAVVDKMIGYALSPAARTSINAKSVGRCQSAGLKLIVDREREIENFVPETYFDIYLYFEKNKNKFKAKYFGKEVSGKEKEVKRIKDKAQCDIIESDCKNNSYTVKNISKKQCKENPKPPFTTSTFQQEANKVFGMSVDRAMSCAQKLFEGISIGGNHVGLITYIRTDDSSLAPEFVVSLEKYIKQHYGKNYFGGVAKKSNSQNSQEAHEALRVVNLEMTPTELEKHITDTSLLKIYKLIWERTVCCAMSAALINDTEYTINNGDHLFKMHSKEIEFDGYRKIFGKPQQEDSEENSLVLETFICGEQLKKTKLQTEEKKTQPPKRYSEATFIKELDKRGIGRPSTFATIINTIKSKDRGYCEVKDKALCPTSKGCELCDYLSKNFPDVVDFDYTKQLEQNLDDIANGRNARLDFLNSFYKKLDESLQHNDSNSSGRKCPQCGSVLVKRKSKYGYFWGCSSYPKCGYILNIKSGVKNEQI